ncbi:MAG: hypothetical protein JRG85_00125 [Deltaproteobacteria bacterium]|nr:hypothetical protein [Deltaproteobacteria bacterium]
MARIADAERARRLARAILSDVLLYNRDTVREGLERDDLFERLEGHFEEARAYFESRVEPELLHKENFVDRAIVDVLICGSRSVRARIW